MGKLDPAAIAQVREEAWPDVRDADELADALQTLVALPESSTLPEWLAFFDQLRAQRRALRAQVNGAAFWLSAEKLNSFRAVYPEAALDDTPPAISFAEITHDDAVLSLVTGWTMHSGPLTASPLAQRLSLPTAEIEKTLIRLEASGAILRGKFAGQTEEIEFCDRRLLARIHRLTLGTLRKQIEPVTAALYMRWLLRWQHVAPGMQLPASERGMLEILRQLQGFEVPASAWEREVLARRIMSYDAKLLDQLSLSGAIGWGRLSPHPATLEDSNDGRRRVIPTSVAPITFFVREESDWMLPGRSSEDEISGRGLSPVAREVLEFLRRQGASFFADMVRGTGKLKAEVETGLWELVAAGLITADGFDNLRALINPKRRGGEAGHRTSRPRHSTGRWALLHRAAAPASEMAREKSLEATCNMLLQRYGVIFREVLAREALLPKWRELLQAFRRLEARGEVRGGRFISGFIGEQFALPIAVESLRAMRKSEPSGETVTVSAADPLNLVGIIVPGERVPAISGRFVSFRDGAAVESESSSQLMAAVR